MRPDYVATSNTTTLRTRGPVASHELDDAEKMPGRRRYSRGSVVLDVSSATASPTILVTKNLQAVTPPSGDSASALSWAHGIPLQPLALEGDSETARALSEIWSAPIEVVADDIANALADGEDDHLEDGYSSVLERKLSRLLVTGGTAAVFELANSLRRERHSGEVVKVACKTLGLLRYTPTAEARLEVLTSLLKSENPAVRDAAALGLALLDDKRAIPAVRQAVARERIASLRSDLQDILEQLSS